MANKKDVDLELEEMNAEYVEESLRDAGVLEKTEPKTQEEVDARIAEILSGLKKQT